MRIGLDARFLTHPQPGGFKTYTTNLVKALGAIDHENEYVVYVDRELHDAAITARPNMSYVVVDGTATIVGVPIREQVKLRNRIAQDRLDVVHFLCNTASVGLRQAHVLTLHDTIQVTSLQRIPLTRGYRALKTWAQTEYSRRTIAPVARTASQIITVSEYERLQIHGALHVPLDRISVTYEAPDPMFSECLTPGRGRSAVLDGTCVRGRYILGIGYEPRKNIPLLITAFGECAREHPDLDLVIVAANEGQRRSFMTLLSERMLASRSAVLAATSPADLADLYRGAEVFVFPSEREAFGLPVLEAMACGVPTVAMRGSSLPEIAGDAALLVEGRDPLVWTRAIASLLRDDSPRKDMRRRGLARARQFSWERCAEQTLAVYRKVGASNTPPRVA